MLGLRKLHFSDLTLESTYRKHRTKSLLLLDCLGYVCSLLLLISSLNVVYQAPSDAAAAAVRSPHPPSVQTANVHDNIKATLDSKLDEVLVSAAAFAAGQQEGPPPPPVQASPPSAPPPRGPHQAWSRMQLWLLAYGLYAGKVPMVLSIVVVPLGMLLLVATQQETYLRPKVRDALVSGTRTLIPIIYALSSMACSTFQLASPLLCGPCFVSRLVPSDAQPVDPSSCPDPNVLLQTAAPAIGPLLLLRALLFQLPLSLQLPVSLLEWLGYTITMFLLSKPLPNQSSSSISSTSAVSDDAPGAALSEGHGLLLWSGLAGLDGFVIGVVCPALLLYLLDRASRKRFLKQHQQQQLAEEAAAVEAFIPRPATPAGGAALAHITQEASRAVGTIAAIASTNELTMSAPSRDFGLPPPQQQQQAGLRHRRLHEQQNSQGQHHQQQQQEVVLRTGGNGVLRIHDLGPPEVQLTSYNHHMGSTNAGGSTDSATPVPALHLPLVPKSRTAVPYQQQYQQQHGHSSATTTSSSSSNGNNGNSSRSSSTTGYSSTDNSSGSVKAIRSISPFDPPRHSRRHHHHQQQQQRISPHSSSNSISFEPATAAAAAPTSAVFISRSGAGGGRGSFEVPGPVTPTMEESDTPRRSGSGNSVGEGRGAEGGSRPGRGSAAAAAATAFGGRGLQVGRALVGGGPRSPLYSSSYYSVLVSCKVALPQPPAPAAPAAGGGGGGALVLGAAPTSIAAATVAGGGGGRGGEQQHQQHQQLAAMSAIEASGRSAVEAAATAAGAIVISSNAVSFPGCVQTVLSVLLQQPARSTDPSAPIIQGSLLLDELRLRLGSSLPLVGFTLVVLDGGSQEVEAWQWSVGGEGGWGRI